MRFSAAFLFMILCFQAVQAQKTRSDSADILNYDINLTIRNLQTKMISGYAVLDIAVKSDSITILKIDLLKLAVTRVMIDSADVPYVQNDSALLVTVNRKRNSPEDMFSLHIEYSGKPVSDPQWGGFYFSGNYAYNMGVGFKSDPHNFGRCWFPCFDNFTDRATYSFHITTDAGWKAVCGGLKEAENTNSDGSITWNWKLTEPVPTYLASVAVGKYEFVKYEFAGMNKTYPVWLAVEAADTAKARQSFNRLNTALQCFEGKFGAYPFSRIGYVGVPFSAGAMEHASNIAYPLYAIDGTTNYETLFAHELSHMWWGDKATCRTAGDMWLNEGWASFCEALFLECAYGKEAYSKDILDKLNEVMKTAPENDGGYQPVSGIGHDITYGTHVYKKGALVAHSLRTVMGDQAFFAACKSYLAKYHFKDVSSEDLKNEFQAFTSADLTDFFKYWVYEKGHADIVLTKWELMPGNATNFLSIRAEQLARLASGYRKDLPVTISVYNEKLERKEISIRAGISPVDTMLRFPSDFNPEFAIVNEDAGLALGKTLDMLTINTKGLKQLNNALLSLNVQDAPDSAVIVAEHHWTSPMQGTLREKGIRISPERYWSIKGIIPSTFRSWGFFNYDGTTGNYLDRELMSSIATEDSMVLLYRPGVSSPWQIHTDNTFQPGTKTDKTGRFWVNNLQQGEYAFGIRDHRVVGVKEATGKMKKGAVLIYPNPSDNRVTVDFSGMKRLPDTIEVYNVSGQLIRSVSVNKAHAIVLDIRDWNTGTYYIVSGEGSEKTTTPFIVK